MKSCEHFCESRGYREDYWNSIKRLMEQKRAESYENREKFAAELIENREEYRDKLKKMLGWPLSEKRAENINVRLVKVELERDYDVYRLEAEVFEGFWYYGMLFRHRDNEKRQLVISQHGGGGTPELCSGVWVDTFNYNGMTERLIKLGANVFAPQMLLWGGSEHGPFYDDRKTVDKDLKHMGSSITALEVFCLQSALDYLEKQDFVDSENITMAGLSYGGFYTLMFTAIDTRIKRAIACAQFNDRLAYPWEDWVWFNSANTFGDAELAMLAYPRKLTVCVGDKDELFDSEKALQEAERVKSRMKKYPANWFDFMIFSGNHEFIRDDEILKKALF